MDARLESLRQLGLEVAVRDGVRRILESPLLPDGFTASGAIWDVATGELRTV
jgi:hypothetical protein